MKHDLHTQILI